MCQDNPHTALARSGHGLAWVACDGREEYHVLAAGRIVDRERGGCHRLIRRNSADASQPDRALTESVGCMPSACCT